MKNPKPLSATTRVDPATGDWCPASFTDFLSELERLTSRGLQTDSLILYRGHKRREWLLDSTFARSCKSVIFGVPVEQRLSALHMESSEYHHALAALYLLKFGEVVVPCAELVAAEHEKGVDAWFELMKRIQQYPEIDVSALEGSNFIDWSRSADIALYFANEGRLGEGAVYVCDASATGKTLQTNSVVDVINRMAEIRDSGHAFGGPLLFSPPRQISYERAKNQQAVYFAQMDMRLDLETIWRKSELTSPDTTVLVKLILPSDSVKEVSEYLTAKGITRQFVYPD